MFQLGFAEMGATNASLKMKNIKYLSWDFFLPHYEDKKGVEKSIKINKAYIKNVEKQFIMNRIEFIM